MNVATPLEINSCLISDIYAVQIIKEVLYPNYISESSYHLNLVLSNGERIYVKNFKEIDKVRLDAKMIGTMLKVPIWDSTKR